MANAEYDRHMGRTHHWVFLTRYDLIARLIPGTFVVFGLMWLIFDGYGFLKSISEYGIGLFAFLTLILFAGYAIGMVLSCSGIYPRMKYSWRRNIDDFYSEKLAKFIDVSESEFREKPWDCHLKIHDKVKRLDAPLGSSITGMRAEVRLCQSLFAGLLILLALIFCKILFYCKVRGIDFWFLVNDMGYGNFGIMVVIGIVLACCASYSRMRSYIFRTKIFVEMLTDEREVKETAGI